MSTYKVSPGATGGLNVQTTVVSQVPTDAGHTVALHDPPDAVLALVPNGSVIVTFVTALLDGSTREFTLSTCVPEL
ncbi:MAG TPA: hypothetical protein VN740_05450 [Solirubrobacteraceae bacterium]|nr:hypothetical protein [Solirubrobacteraceae bacterium]